jgi:hypothetical protein
MLSYTNPKSSERDSASNLNPTEEKASTPK